MVSTRVDTTTNCISPESSVQNAKKWVFLAKDYRISVNIRQSFHFHTLKIMYDMGYRTCWG